MRHIHLSDDLRIRFPGRDENFAEGAEIGMLAAFMSLDLPQFGARIAPSSLEQARALAPKLGYCLVVEGEDAACLSVTLRKAQVRPTLRVVG